MWHAFKRGQIISMKQKAIFLDRDGTLNEDIGYAKSIADIKLFPDAPAALKQFKELGFQLIVITNQAVISRGWVSEEQMNTIHEQMNEMIALNQGTTIDAYYFCPHHPHSTLPKYGIVCECRKPACGLILRAAREHDVDLGESWMIGDKLTDIVAGKKAGCKTILIVTPKSYETNVSGVEFDKATMPDYECKNLSEAAEIIRSFHS